MTADSLDLSAVTPAAEVNQRSSKGHAHSTPNDDQSESKDKLLKGNKSKQSKQPQAKSTTKQQPQVHSIYCVLNKQIFIIWLIVKKVFDLHHRKYFVCESVVLFA